MLSSAISGTPHFSEWRKKCCVTVKTRKCRNRENQENGLNKMGQKLAEIWAPKTTAQKIVFVRLWLTWKAQQSLLLVTSQNNQPIKLVKEQRVDQSEHGDFVGERSKFKTSGAKHQIDRTTPSREKRYLWKTGVLILGLIYQVFENYPEKVS